VDGGMIESQEDQLEKDEDDDTEQKEGEEQNN